MSDYMVEESSGPLAIAYRPIVIAIHWISALLVVSQIAVGLKFADMPKGPERMDVFSWHKTIGVLILLLALARLAVRLVDPPPPYPQDFPRWERALAVWSHRLLYVLLIGLPLTGLAAVSKRAENGLTELRWGLEFPVVPLPALGGVHEVLAWSLVALLVIHVGAALKNQFLTGGPVAGRMPPFRATAPRA